MNPLIELQKFGQSVWLDFITRRFIAEGKLQRLIAEDGLRGVTSNPTIFQKAIIGGTEYDAAIRRLLDEKKTPAAVFEAIAIEDVQQACDVLLPVYKTTNGSDGFVSIEVSPGVARDTEATLDEVRRLHRGVNRPNVMVKIPGTKEGIPAIEQGLSEGININITLIFSLKRYQEVIDAWLAGIGRLAAKGGDIGSISSVASFFVSRVDAMVDSQLEKKISAASGDQKKELEALLGKAAIGNARQAYGIFQRAIGGAPFKTLKEKGARVQRPLWASTSTKNPQYRDVYYVEELIGEQTVNTLPLQTIEAFRDHGRVRKSIDENPAESAEMLQRL
jgi:transaldolase